jgi:class 3 adenylate cyclase
VAGAASRRWRIEAQLRSAINPRAARCGAAIRDRAQDDGLQIRAGVHSGDVERQAGLPGLHRVYRAAQTSAPDRQ